MNTIQEAKQSLRANWEKGISCPCCGQFVKRYGRSITSSMAYGLILLHKYFVKNPSEEWLHVSSYFSDLNIPSPVKQGMGDFAKLKYWGFIESAPEHRDDGSPRNGYWKITESGKMFAFGEMSVPSKIFLYDSKVVGIGENMMTIRDALRKKFDYSELMNSV